MHRCDVLSEHYRKRLPEICEPFLPGIREIVNGDIPYAEVVAKILTPDRVQDCNPFEVDEFICLDNLQQFIME